VPAHAVGFLASEAAAECGANRHAHVHLGAFLEHGPYANRSNRRTQAHYTIWHGQHDFLRVSDPVPDFVQG
jgi:hypothetical protein